MRLIHFKRHLRSVVYVLVFSLCLTDLPASPAHAATVTPKPASALTEIKLPASLGTLQSVSARLPHEPHQPFVFVIQDAHAIAGAQRSIQRIIKYLNHEYGVELFGVEGADKSLDGLLFQNFPDKTTLDRVFESYNQKGEVSGVVLAAVLNEENSHYFGAEKWSLYEENIEIFLQALEDSPAHLQKIKDLNARVNQIKSAFLASYKAELDKTLTLYASNETSLPELLEGVSTYISSHNKSINLEKYPLVAAAIKHIRPSEKSDLQRMHEEIEALTKQILSNLDVKAQRSEFAGKAQAYETEKITPEDYLLYLNALAERHQIGVKFSGQLLQHLNTYRTLMEVQGDDFNAELKSFIDYLKDCLYETDFEKQLYRAGRRVQLTQKLIKFELTRLELDELQSTKSSELIELNRAVSAQAISDAQHEAFLETTHAIASVFRVFDETFALYTRFYELAQLREEALLKNTLNQVHANQKSSAALVVGGFHSQGIVAQLEKSGINYALITPAVSDVPDETSYLDTMQGNVSWRKHFENQKGAVPVFRAFSEDAAERLIKAQQEKNPNGTGEILKQWRDNVLHQLAAEKRLSQARDYTYFIDHLLLNSRDQLEIEKLQTRWTNRVDAWIHQILPQISTVVSSTAVSWNANLILQRGSRVRRSWVRPRVIQAPQAETVSQSVSAGAAISQDTEIRSEQRSEKKKSKKSKQRKRAKTLMRLWGNIVSFFTEIPILGTAIWAWTLMGAFVFFGWFYENRILDSYISERPQVFNVTDGGKLIPTTSLTNHITFEDRTGDAKLFVGKGLDGTKEHPELMSATYTALREDRVRTKEITKIRAEALQVDADGELYVPVHIDWQTGSSISAGAPRSVNVNVDKKSLKPDQEDLLVLQRALSGKDALENHNLMRDALLWGYRLLLVFIPLSFWAMLNGIRRFHGPSVTSSKDSSRLPSQSLYQGDNRKNYRRGDRSELRLKTGEASADFDDIRSEQRSEEDAGHIIPPRHTLVQLKQNGSVKIAVHEEKDQLPAAEGEHVILYGEAGIRAALALQILLGQSSSKGIDEWGPFDDETDIFINRLLRARATLESKLGKDIKIERLEIEESAQPIWVFALTSPASDKRFVFALNLKEPQSRQPRKDYIAIKVPQAWLSQTQRNIHKMKDYAPRIFNHKPGFQEYTQENGRMRIGLSSYATPVTSNDNISMHLMEVETLHVPPLEVYIHQADTRRAASEESGFLPAPNRVTTISADQPVQVMAKVYLNDKYGKPAKLTPEEVSNLVVAEVEHNFFYDGKRRARAKVVAFDPEEHDPRDGYTFALELEAPEQPGFYEINMSFHMSGDVQGVHRIYSLADQKFAAVLLPPREADRQIEGKVNRRRLSEREMNHENLEIASALDADLKQKAILAHSYSMQDAFKTGALFAASNPTKGHNRTYLYSWIRDGVQDGLKHLQAHEPEILELAHNFLDFIWDGYSNDQSFTDQRWRRVNGKVVIPSTSFNYPQTDGPAHIGRFALEFLRYAHSERYIGTDKEKSRDISRARKLLEKAVYEVSDNAKNTYTYLKQGEYEEDPRGFDIWEELYGIHFANLLTNYSFLKDVYLATENKEGLRIPAALQSLVKDPLYADLNPIELLEDVLRGQFNARLTPGYNRHHFVSHRHVVQSGKMESEKHDARLDIQQIWALLYAKHIPFSFGDTQVIGTMNALTDIYDGRFPFSEKVTEQYPHVVAMGRYDLDPYDGSSMLEEPFVGSNIAMTGAHFWFIATLWRIQFDMRYAASQIEQGFFEVASVEHQRYLEKLLSVDSPGVQIELNDNIGPDDARYQLILKALQNRVDQTLEFVAGYINPDRSLYEQFHREDGQPYGTADLNWSNGTFVQAVVQRDQFKKLLDAQDLLAEPKGVYAPSEKMPLQLLTVKEIENLFSSKHARFVWRSSNHQVESQGEPGLAGLIHTFQRLKNQNKAAGVLVYHSNRNAEGGGELIPYIYSVLDKLPAELSGLREIIVSESAHWATLSASERAERYEKILSIIDDWLLSTAGMMLERYLNEKDATQAAEYQSLFEQELFRDFALRYLRERKNTKPLDVSVAGLYAFTTEVDGEPRIIAVNTEAIAYPDPSNPAVFKAWGKILPNDNYREFLKKSKAKEKGFLYTLIDPQTGERYRSYRSSELKPFLDIGVPGLQVLSIEKKPAPVSSHLAALSRKAETTALGMLEPLVAQIRELVRTDPEALRVHLADVASHTREEAVQIFGEASLSSLMAFITMLIPDLLDDMSEWDRQTYEALRAVVDENSVIFTQGRIEFLSPSRQHSTVLISRSVNEDENFVLAVQLAPDAVSTYDFVPKVWTTVVETEPLKLNETSIYQIKDAVRGKVYDQRFGADILQKGWQIGIPVYAPQIRPEKADYPVGFQLLQLKRKHLPAGVQAPHDMQIKEINARGFLEIQGSGDPAERHYRSFDDVTDEEILAWKNAGYNTIWMMGIWTESHASRAINQKYEDENGRGRVASAFSTPDYELNPRFGDQDILAEYDRMIIKQREAIEAHGRFSPEEKQASDKAGEFFKELARSKAYRQAIEKSEAAFIRFTKRAQNLGVRILVDFIPNHLSADSHLIDTAPEMFIHLTHAPNDDVKDFYFEHVLPDGKSIWVAHGKDGTPWQDTAQLNLEAPETWEFFKERMRYFGEVTHGGGTRIDSLQVLKPEEYWNSWQHQLQSDSFEAFQKKLERNAKAVFGKKPERTNNPFEPLNEFIRGLYPDFKSVGEVYHGQHPHWQQAGVDITYVKYTYNWLVHEQDGSWHDFKDHILRRGAHAGLSTEYLFRASYLLEDHDERERILHALAERLAKGVDDEVIAWSKLLATAIATVPGVGMTYEGQEGGAVNLISSADWVVPFHLRNSEPVNQDLKQFYADLHRQTIRPIFRRGSAPERIPLKGIEGGELPQILAFTRTYRDREAVVVLNHSREKAEITLDLTHLGLPGQTVSLEPWGTHVEVIKRSEQRSRDEIQQQRQLRRLIFEERMLNDEFEETILTLIPEPVLKFLKQNGVERDDLAWQMGVRGIRPKSGKPIKFIVRITYQGPDNIAVGIYPHMPEYRTPPAPVVHLPLQIVDDDTILIAHYGVLAKINNAGDYTDNRMRYWIEHNLDEFSRRLGFKYQRVVTTVDGLHAKGLKEMSFRDYREYFERSVPRGAPRHELRYSRDDAEFFERGPAAEAEFTGEDLSASELEPLLEYIQSKLSALTPGDMKSHAEKVFQHLKTLAGAKKIDGFDEMRWANDSYRFAFIETDLIAIARGLLIAGDKAAEHPEHLAFAAENLYVAAEKSFRLKNKTAALPDIDTVSGAVFNNTNFNSWVSKFRNLEDPIYLDSALERFTAFDSGGKYFHTDKLFEAWLESEKTGKPVPELNQAGFLAKVLWPSAQKFMEPYSNRPDRLGPLAGARRSLPGDLFNYTISGSDTGGADISRSDSMAGDLKVADLERLNSVRRDKEEEIKKQARILYPLLSFAMYRIEFLVDFDLISRALAYKFSDLTREEFYRRVHTGSFELKPDNLPEFSSTNLRLSKAVSPAAYRERLNQYARHLNRALRLGEAWLDDVRESYFGETAAAMELSRMGLNVSVSELKPRVPHKIKIPEFISVFDSEIKAFFMSYGGVRLGDYITHPDNLFAESATGIISKISEPTEESHGAASFVILDGAPVGAQNLPNKNVYIERDLENDRVTEYIYRQSIWNEFLELIHGTTPLPEKSEITEMRIVDILHNVFFENDRLPVSTHDHEMTTFLKIIMMIKRITLEIGDTKIKGSYYAPDDLDLTDWADRLIELRNHFNMHYWNLAKEVYGSLNNFHKEAERNPEAAENLWQYFLFNHKESPLKAFADILEWDDDDPDPYRLSEQSIFSLIDILFALYWAGPARVDRADHSRFIFDQIYEHILLYPLHLSARRNGKLEEFLTRYQIPDDLPHTLERLREWTVLRDEDFGPVGDDWHFMSMRGGAFEPTDGPRAVSRMPYATLIDPAIFPAYLFLEENKQPWYAMTGQQTVWHGTYTNQGLRIPGTDYAFKLNLDKLPVHLTLIGSEFRMRIQGDTFYLDYLHVTEDYERGRSGDVEIFHVIETPVTELKHPYYTSGQSEYGYWLRLPVVSNEIEPAPRDEANQEIVDDQQAVRQMFEINALRVLDVNADGEFIGTHADAGDRAYLSEDGYYRLPVNANGLLRLPLEDNEIALGISAQLENNYAVVHKSGDRYTLYRDRIVDTPIHELDQNVVLGVLSINGTRHILEQGASRLEILPGLLPETAHITPQNKEQYEILTENVRNFERLKSVVAVARPYMRQGRIYSRIDLIDSSADEIYFDVTAGVLHISKAFLERPEILTEHLDQAMENDPVLQAKKYRKHLRTVQSDAVKAFDPAQYAVHETPQVSSAGWPEEVQKKYDEIWNDIRTIIEQLRVMRLIDENREKHNNKKPGEKSSLGEMGREAFRKLLVAALNERSKPFYFIQKGGNYSYGSYGAFKGRSHDVEGAGITAPIHFKYTLDNETDTHDFTPVEMSDRIGSDPYFYIYHEKTLKGKGKKKNAWVMSVFSLENGQLLDEAKILRETHEKQIKQKKAAILEEVRIHEADWDMEYVIRLIDEFLERVGTLEDENLSAGEILAIRNELLGQILDIMHKALNSAEHTPELNYAVLRIILEDILKEGSRKATKRAEAINRAYNQGRADILSGLQVPLVLSFAVSFDLDVEGIGEKSEEEPASEAVFLFREFLENVILPMVRNTELNEAIIKDSFYQNNIFDYALMQNNKIESLLTANPKAAEEDGSAWLDIQLARQYELVGPDEKAPEPTQRHFIRKFFEKKYQAEAEAAAAAAKEKKGQIPAEETSERGTHIRPWGGVQGIGASAKLVEYKGHDQTQIDSIIVDYGLKIDDLLTPPVSPQSLEQFKNPVQAVFITHAHFDHIGGLVYLWKKILRTKVPVYVTDGTYNQMQMVLYGITEQIARIKAAGKTPHIDFTQADVDELMKAVKVLRENQWYGVSEKMRVRFHGPVGHLHGAASLIISTPDSGTLMTGDISIHDQGPTPGFTPIPQEIAEQIDQVDTETTYGIYERGKSFAEADQEKQLIDETMDVLRRKDARVLFPAFANGRSQRILLLLLRQFKALQKAAGGGRDSLKIYIDGQAAAFTKLYLEEYPEVFEPYSELFQNGSVVLISNDPESRGRMRSEAEERAHNQKTIIISSAGNASQGRSLYWATRFVNHKNSAIFFTGYADPQEVGSKLRAAALRGESEFNFDVQLFEGRLRFMIEKYQRSGDFQKSGKDAEDLLNSLKEVSKLGTLPINARIKSFKLSGHASGYQIVESILDVLGEQGKKRLQVLLGHGDPQKLREFESWIKKQRPLWAPVILQVLKEYPGAIVQTYEDLERRRAFFESLSEETIELADVYRPAETVRVRAELTEVPAEAAAARSEDTQADAPEDETISEAEEEPVLNTQDLKLRVFEQVVVSGSLTNAVSKLSDDEVLAAREMIRTANRGEGNKLLNPADGSVSKYSVTDTAVERIRKRAKAIVAERKTDRHELRELMEPALSDLALSSEDQLPALGDAQQQAFRHYADKHGQDALVREIKAEAKSVYYLVLFGGLSKGHAVAKLLEKVSKLHLKYPDYELKSENFSAAVLRLFFEYEAAALEMDTSAERNYAFAMTIDSDTRDQLQPWVLEYLNQVEKLKQKFPGRVKGQVELYAPSLLYGSQQEDWKSFLKTVGRSRVGKVVEAHNAATARFNLERFLKSNKNALIYGFERSSVAADHKHHVVRSAIEGVHPEVTFTLAALLSLGLAEEQERLEPELLREITEPISDIIRFNQDGLEITDVALEIMYRYQAAELIAAMA